MEKAKTRCTGGRKSDRETETDRKRPVRERERDSEVREAKKPGRLCVSTEKTSRSLWMEASLEEREIKREKEKKGKYYLLRPTLE